MREQGRKWEASFTNVSVVEVAGGKRDEPLAGELDVFKKAGSKYGQGKMFVFVDSMNDFGLVTRSRGNRYSLHPERYRLPS